MTSHLPPHCASAIRSATGATSGEVTQLVQTLWSGYGQILRIQLEGAPQTSVIAKRITITPTGVHPRGWDTDLSHQRKLTSYQVEAAWYRSWAQRCGNSCRIPELITYTAEQGEMILILEDLDGAGFPARITSATSQHITSCLDWLAQFHATFMGSTPTDLWQTGTYWHLATRSEEWASMTDLPLKQAAKQIDHTLSSARYQTIVHGDAKLANFCFSPSGSRVAAVDFQYVGGGCGMKDVAYFIGSCLDEHACEAQESRLLDHYFTALRSALASTHPSLDSAAVEAEWRALFPLAWTDFHRFLKGWSPDHWKIHSYSERLARNVLATL